MLAKLPACRLHDTMWFDPNFKGNFTCSRSYKSSGCTCDDWLIFKLSNLCTNDLKVWFDIWLCVNVLCDEFKSALFIKYQGILVKLPSCGSVTKLLWRLSFCIIRRISFLIVCRAFPFSVPPPTLPLCLARPWQHNQTFWNSWLIHKEPPTYNNFLKYLLRWFAPRFEVVRGD